MALTSILLTWTIAVGIFVYLIQKIYKDLLPYFVVNKAFARVSGPGGHWLIGQTKKLTPDQNGLLLNAKRAEIFPKVQRIIRLWPFAQFLSGHWPSVLQTMLATDVPKDSIGNKLMKPWIGDGILLSTGPKWKRNRRLLTPAFHFEILKNYLSIFNKSAEVLVEKWKNQHSVSVFENVSLLALDNMLLCTMSTQTNCQIRGRSHPYVRAIATLANISVNRFFKPWLINDFIFKLTSYGKEYNDALKIVHDQSRSVIESRRKELLDNKTLEEIQKYRKHDFLDILLLARGPDGKGLTDQEIQDEVDTFLFEGHDTTSSAISWVLYNLSTHPEHQDLCRKEVLEAMQNSSTVEWDDLAKFNYLTMCIKESMRTHPPVPLVLRDISKPMTFDKDFNKDQFNVSSMSLRNSSQTFPVGTRMEVNIFTLHRNPFVWKNPEKFDPNRFTKDNIEKRSSHAYLPFSAGPRNCIGQNFAMMEIKTTVALILKNFEITLDENFAKPEMIYRIILKAKDDIHLKLRPLAGGEN